MSRETMTWLNTRTLIGHTLKRGEAWHYRQSEQHEGNNHFAGPVPLERAVALLDSPQLTEGTAESSCDVITDDGVTRYHVVDPGRKSIVRLPGSFGPQDPGAILGSHRAGYALHGYGQWLLRNSERILAHAEGELEIGTVGLLKGGAVAWAQFEMPKNVTSASGVELAPFFAATTSCDGSIATGYMIGTQLIVCDNTLAVADSQAERAGNRVSIRHTTGSLDRVGDVQETLGLLVAHTQAFAAQIDALALQRVSPAQFDQFLRLWAPVKDDASKAGKTQAKNRRDAFASLYLTDERVTPWTGTAFGILQADNTYRTHVKRVVGDTRYGRAMHDFIRGESGRNDAHTLDLIRTVLN